MVASVTTCGVRTRWGFGFKGGNWVKHGDKWILLEWSEHDGRRQMLRWYHPWNEPTAAVDWPV